MPNWPGEYFDGALRHNAVIVEMRINFAEGDCLLPQATRKHLEERTPYTEKLRMEATDVS